jgi:hypothetical protein
LIRRVAGDFDPAGFRAHRRRGLLRVGSAIPAISSSAVRQATVRLGNTSRVPTHRGRSRALSCPRAARQKMHEKIVSGRVRSMRFV